MWVEREGGRDREAEWSRVGAQSTTISRTKPNTQSHSIMIHGRKGFSSFQPFQSKASGVPLLLLGAGTN